MKKQLLILCTIILFIGIALQGIFGIVISLLLCGIIGLVAGLYKKDKSIWQPSLFVLFASISAILIFIILLINSDM